MIRIFSFLFDVDASICMGGWGDHRMTLGYKWMRKWHINHLWQLAGSLWGHIHCPEIYRRTTSAKKNKDNAGHFTLYSLTIANNVPSPFARSWC